MTTIVARYDPTTKEFEIDKLPSSDLAVMVVVAADAVPHEKIIGWAKPKAGPSNLRIVADLNAAAVAQISPMNAGIELPVYEAAGDFYRVGQKDAPLFIHQSKVTYREA